MQEDEKERNQHTKTASGLLLHLEDHQGSDVSQHLLSLKTCTLALRSKTFNIFHVSLHSIKLSIPSHAQRIAQEWSSCKLPKSKTEEMKAQKDLKV
jgi:hypothetical protein